MPITAIVHILKSCLVVLTALFPIVNPIGNTPIFLSLTPGYSTDSRTILSRKIALNSFWLLTGSMLIGSHILSFFGISIPVVQVGGGFVVMSTGWKLLQQRDGKSNTPVPKKDHQPGYCESRFYPLTLPLTVGPGSISVALTLGVNEAPQQSNLIRLIAAVVGPALMAFSIYLSYRFAERIARVLGKPP